MATDKPKTEATKPAEPAAAAPSIASKTDALAPLVADSDNMSTADMAKMLSRWTGGGVDAGDWEVVVAGSVPYWNPKPEGGEVLFGRLERRQEIMAMIKGKATKAFLYTVKLADPCVAAVVTPDGEETTVGPGETVCVIERKILADLANYVGQDVAIFCDGKGKTRAGLDLWRYRVAARRKPAVTPPQVTAG